MSKRKCKHCGRTMRRLDGDVVMFYCPNQTPSQRTNKLLNAMDMAKDRKPSVQV